LGAAVGLGAAGGARRGRRAPLLRPRVGRGQRFHVVKGAAELGDERRKGGRRARQLREAARD